MTTGLTYSGQLVHMGPCWNCGMYFAAPDSFHEACKRKGRNFWCPQCGKSAVYTKTREQDLQEELDREKRRVARVESDRLEILAERDHARAQANGYKGALAKTKKRIRHGVCPCCNRTFADVVRHMANKHPGYGEG